MSRTIKSLGGWTTVTHEILYSKEFLKLQDIGGCHQYHQEGNALTHSFLVYLAAQRMFPSDLMLQCVALLHDIGKILVGRQKPNGDWEYPNHSIVGAEMLDAFIDPEYMHFKEMQWFIRNHIKPLFWRDKGFTKEQAIETLTPYPNGVITKEVFANLVMLVICDLEGSIPADYADSVATINYLRNLLV
jgi:hypothetical protein